MKKVLSALALSAAVLASAGQAYAYDDINIYNGTMLGVIYTDSTEIIFNMGNFLTTNNTAVFDHTFLEEDKLLTTIDYKTILSNRGDTGSVYMSFFIDDMKNSQPTPRNWDVYYATTDLSHGGEAPTPLTGSPSAAPFTKFNSLANTYMTNVRNAANAATPAGMDQVDMIIIDDTSSTGSFWHGQMIGQYTVGAGSIGDINKVSAPWGEMSLDEYADQCEIDMYLFGVRHDTKGNSSLTNDENLSLGQIATLRFDQRTGAITLNATDPVEQCPVPVPAAAWLLGSGVLGLFGLRRRK
jgi:hypothetical protein